MQIRDSLIELRETLLYGALKRQDSGYAERIERFVTGITPIMATTVQHFPFYTRHDAHHGFRVVRRMAQVLLPSCLEPGHVESLTPPELFLLIAAAYAHDLVKSKRSKRNLALWATKTGRRITCFRIILGHCTQSEAETTFSDIATRLAYP
jgi:hypothetical protein